MAKVHNAAWFAKQKARLEEPLKNTVRYYGKRAIAKIATVGLPLIGWGLAIWGTVQLVRLRNYIYNFTNLTTDYMNKGRAITNDGTPGAGKTFTGANVAYFLALEQWEKLKSDYYTQRTMVAQWVKDGETDKLESFRAIKESYLFFAEREADFIPCLITSVPLREYGTGRMSYVLKPEMFLQEERVAECTVFFNDESGKDQGADTSKTGNKNVLAFWRLHRQLIDSMFVNTNQDGNQNAIYMRRSTDFVSHIFGQEWLMRPVALEWKFKRKERRYYRRLERGKISEKRAEHIGQELYFLKKYIATIGFRKVKSQLLLTKGVAIGDVETTILPAIGGVQYDDRAYRKQYKCKDKSIQMQGWEKLIIEELDTSEFDKKIKGDGKA